MSVEALSWVFQHSEARLGARHVLLSIANHAKSDGTGAWPSVETIARESKLSVREVQYCLTTLVEMGELVITRRARACNLYALPRVQSLHRTTKSRVQVATSRVQVTAENDVKIAPESKSIEPSLKQPSKAASKSRFKQARIRTLERILREEKNLIPGERARIEGLLQIERQGASP
jgi:hypothetical protein